MECVAKKMFCLAIQGQGLHDRNFLGLGGTPVTSARLIKVLDGIGSSNGCWLVVQQWLPER